MAQKINFRLLVDIVSHVLLVGTLAFFGYSYIQNQIPDPIPTHWGFDGECDAWGSPSELFLSVFIFVGIHLLLTLLIHKPQWYNYPCLVTEKNRNRLKVIAVDMTRTIRLFSVLLLIALIFVSVCRVQRLSLWIVLPEILLLNAMIIYYIVRMVKAGKQKE